MLKKCHSNLCEGIIRDRFGSKYGKHRSGRSRPKILCVLRLLLLGSLLLQSSAVVNIDIIAVVSVNGGCHYMPFHESE